MLTFGCCSAFGIFLTCTFASNSMRCSRWLDTLSFWGENLAVRRSIFWKQCTAQHNEFSVSLNYLEPKHALEPVKKVFTSVLVIRLLLMVLWPWQASNVSESVHSCLNLHNDEEYEDYKQLTCYSTNEIVLFPNPMRTRMDENLWVTHNSLIGTLRIKRKNIVGNIELFLLFNFVVCIQNLHGKVVSRYIWWKTNNPLVAVETMQYRLIDFDRLWDVNGSQDLEQDSSCLVCFGEQGTEQCSKEKAECHGRSNSMSAGSIN